MRGLADNPELTLDERAYVLRLTAWQAPDVVWALAERDEELLTEQDGNGPEVRLYRSTEEGAKSP